LRIAVRLAEFLAFISAFALAAVAPISASAQSWDGSASNDWTDGTNWSGNVVPAGGNVFVTTTSPNPTVLGVGGAAAATIGQIHIGHTNNSGNLTIQNGSTLVNNSYARIGSFGGSSGIVTVTGAGTSWTINNRISLIVGNLGQGTLNITDGASVVVNPDPQSYVYVGRGNGIVGAMNIANGGTLTSTGIETLVGRDVGSDGIVAIDGAGSRWRETGSVLQLGVNGSGTLNIQNGGEMEAQMGTLVAANGSSSGILNINGGGILDTLSLSAGAGTPQVNFNGGVLQARANNASFITGFSGTELNLAAGGLEVDTGGFDVGTDSTSGFTGIGGLTKTGAGTFTLSGVNTYTGATQINAGTLQAGATGVFSSNSAVTLADTAGATLDLNGFNNSIGSLAGGGAAGGNVTLGAATLTTGGNNTSTSYAGVISGTGGLTKVGTGTQTLTGTNSYSGGTTITAGALQLGNGGTSGSILGDVANNGALTFNRSDTYAFDGVISGTGSVNQTGPGVTVLTGENTYTGGTTIAAGTLQLGNGGTSGSIVGNVANNGMLTFNRSNTYAFDGVISGTGSVSQVGAGTTVLTGANTYSGGTTITAGTLQLGDGGTTGSITGNAAVNGTLTFNRSDMLTFGGIISGAGSLRQIGSGVTELTGDSSGFTGTTSIEAGTLAVNGSLCGAMNVLAGGLLQGTGTVCDTTNAGAIGPGNSFGTLLIDGNYTANGGTLEIEAQLDGDGSPADRLLITGNVTGTTQVNVTNVGGTGTGTGTGATNGISIIQVGGTSAADSFYLPGGYVAAGPYQYALNAFDPASSAAGELDARLTAEGITTFWDYRLQTVLDAQGNPVPAPQIPAYQALPSGAFRYGGEIVGALHEAAHCNLEKRLFVQAEGARTNFRGNRGPSYNQNSWFVQAGFTPVMRDLSNGGIFCAGLAITYGRVDLDVLSSSAQVSMPVVGGAATATYESARGWYLDAAAIVNVFNPTITTNERGVVGQPAGAGIGVSLQAGHSIAMHQGPVWRVAFEPSARLTWQRAWFDSFTDVDNILTRLQGGSSLLGEIGGRVVWRNRMVPGRDTRLHVGAFLKQEFLQGESINAAGVAFPTDLGGTSVRFDAGFETRLSGRTNLNVNAMYEKGLGPGTGDTFGATARIRTTF
jgi:outer membrane autotransporter protein